MYHDYLLFITHLGANHDSLLGQLANQPEISITNEAITYSSPLDLTTLVTACEQDKQARICMGLVSRNHDLKTKDLYDICKFVYFVGDPSVAMIDLIGERKYHPVEALKHYLHRLQRMSIMSKYTNGCYVTDEDYSDLPKYLKLKKELRYVPPAIVEQKVFISQAFFEEAKLIHEYYSKLIKSRCSKLG